ncbi:nickel-dependent hydrogenase large subunit [Amphritea balenae]|uniref:Ni,Fe-hydrogenase I large subunit n=1 Tax=Amphritea balenae TaxID=452629 RepID=A0A3P1SVP3_9GAMM|nr:nickel-dependent hydrogenase large subunit [Amphritea balenae]RRD01025.1 hypothetical protein EHS89_00195 [Amphritea balenae]GGK60620.1 hydrogenase assembly protein HupF [Amphritea balenae]
MAEISVTDAKVSTNTGGAATAINIAGQINLAFDWREGQIRQIKLTSSRPLNSSRIFEGRSPAQSLQLVPLLFSVCTTGQTLAMVAAIEAASGVKPKPCVESARELLLQLENCRELLFRLINDWLPETQQSLCCIRELQKIITEYKQRWSAVFQVANGIDEAVISEITAEVIDARVRVKGLLEKLLEPLLGRPVSGFGEWLCNLSPDAAPGDLPPLVLNIFELQRIYSGIELGAGIAALPPLHQPEQQQVLNACMGTRCRAFNIAPQWQGECAETGSYALLRERLTALAKHHWHQLVLRYSALLLRLSEIPASLTDRATETFVQACRLTPGTGYGVIQTARGQLLHRVVLTDGVVSQYDIVAPTEWNFHPEGLLPTTLQGVHIGSPRQARELCRTMMLLADPCVGFEIQAI